MANSDGTAANFFVDTASEWLKSAAETVWTVGKELAFLLIVLYVTYHALIVILGLLTPLFPARVAALIERLAHQKSAKDLVRECLGELGYRANEIADVVATNERQASRLVGMTDEDSRTRLCRVLNKCTRELPSAMFYGRETPEKTEYYIDTIGSSVDHGTVEELALLVQYLVNQRSAGSRGIDFIMVPKSGNVLLGHTLARMWGYHCIFRKDDGSSSRARAGEADANPDGAMINIEGLKALLERARQSRKQLYGVAIDCNCSGGSSIVRAIDEWNRVAAVESELVSPISEVFVLYRPDRSELCRVCADGRDVHYKRFFDLTEAQKRVLSGNMTDKQIRKLARDASVNGE